LIASDCKWFFWIICGYVEGNWGNKAFPEFPDFPKSLRQIHNNKKVLRIKNWLFITGITMLLCFKPWFDDVGRVSGETEGLLLASSKLYNLFSSSLSSRARLRLWKLNTGSLRQLNFFGKILYVYLITLFWNSDRSIKVLTFP